MPSGKGRSSVGQTMVILATLSFATACFGGDIITDDETMSDICDDAYRAADEDNSREQSLTKLKVASERAREVAHDTKDKLHERIARALQKQYESAVSGKMDEFMEGSDEVFDSCLELQEKLD